MCLHAIVFIGVLICAYARAEIEVVSGDIATTEEALEALTFCSSLPQHQLKSLKSYRTLINYFTNHARDMEYAYMRATIIDLLSVFKTSRERYLAATPLRYGFLCGFFMVLMASYATIIGEQARRADLGTVFAMCFVFIGIMVCGFQCLDQQKDVTAYHDHETETVIARLENLIAISEHSQHT